MPFRSMLTGKYPIGREFQRIAVRERTDDTGIQVTSRNGDRKIIQSIKILKSEKGHISPGH